MSLTYSQIEAYLLDGISVESSGREFTAKLIPESDDVVITEMTGFRRFKIPLESVVDHAHATETGSDLTDLGVLKRLLTQLIATLARLH